MVSFSNKSDSPSFSNRQLPIANLIGLDLEGPHTIHAENLISLKWYFSTYALTETEAVGTGSAPGPLYIYYGFQFNFYGIPECVNGYLSDSCAYSWVIFLLLVCFV